MFVFIEHSRYYMKLRKRYRWLSTKCFIRFVRMISRKKDSCYIWCDSFHRFHGIEKNWWRWFQVGRTPPSLAEIELWKNWAEFRKCWCGERVVWIEFMWQSHSAQPVPVPWFKLSTITTTASSLPPTMEVNRLVLQDEGAECMFLVRHHDGLRRSPARGCRPPKLGRDLISDLPRSNNNGQLNTRVWLLTPPYHHT